MRYAAVNATIFRDTEEWVTPLLLKIRSRAFSSANHKPKEKLHVPGRQAHPDALRCLAACPCDLIYRGPERKKEAQPTYAFAAESNKLVLPQ